jgi:hypothetical protein
MFLSFPIPEETVLIIVLHPLSKDLEFFEGVLALPQNIFYLTQYPFTFTPLLLKLWGF